MNTRGGLFRWDVVAFSIVMSLAVGAAGAQEPCPPYASEGWDGGDPNGWLGTAGTELTVPLSGGNPGGFLQADNDSLIAAQTSLPPWNGDWGASNIARVTVDLNYLTADLVQPHVRLRRDAITNGWYFVLEPIGVNDGLWHHYEVRVNPWWTDQQAEAAGWEEAGGTHVSFADTLASVGYVQIGASSITGSQLLGIDNVTLTPCLFSDGFESGDTSAWNAAVP